MRSVFYRAFVEELEKQGASILSDIKSSPRAIAGSATGLGLGAGAGSLLSGGSATGTRVGAALGMGAGMGIGTHYDNKARKKKKLEKTGKLRLIRKERFISSPGVHAQRSGVKTKLTKGNPFRELHEIGAKRTRDTRLRKRKILHGMQKHNRNMAVGIGAGSTALGVSAYRKEKKKRGELAKQAKKAWVDPDTLTEADITATPEQQKRYRRAQRGAAIASAGFVGGYLGTKHLKRARNKSLAKRFAAIKRP